MKSLVYEGNNTLAVKDIKPPEVRKGEVLIRVHFTGICGTDMLIWHDGMARVKPPVVLGHEFSGVIEQVGDPESKYKVGDRVVVEPLLTCGTCKACKSGTYNVCTSLKLIGIDADGGMAKYVKAPENKLFRISSSVSFEDAAFVEPLAVGVHMIRQSGIKAGQTALVTGGGPIGLIAASIAKLKGASVYISEINPYRIEKARELGISVINPQEEKVADKIRSVTNGNGADVALEATGTGFGVADCVEATGVKGRIVIAGLPKKLPTIDTYQIVAKELTIVGSRVYKSEDYQDAIQLIESGLFKPKPFISRVVTLDDAITGGFQSIERGDPVMKILINLENED